MFIYEIYKKDINLLLELAGDFKILIQRNFPQTKNSKKKKLKTSHIYKYYKKKESKI